MGNSNLIGSLFVLVPSAVYGLGVGAIKGYYAAHGIQCDLTYTTPLILSAGSGACLGVMIEGNSEVRCRQYPETFEPAVNTGDTGSFKIVEKRTSELERKLRDDSNAAVMRGAGWMGSLALVENAACLAGGYCLGYLSGMLTR